MKSLGIVDAGLVLLSTQLECAPYPGLQELIEELRVLRHRLKHRLHRREHSGHTTEAIDIAGVELVVDYTYTPLVPAPPCSNPGDSRFSVPDEDETLEIHHVWSHDNIFSLLRPNTRMLIRGDLETLEHKQRGIL